MLVAQPIAPFPALNPGVSVALFAALFPAVQSPFKVSDPWRLNVNCIVFGVPVNSMMNTWAVLAAIGNLTSYEFKISIGTNTIAGLWLLVSVVVGLVAITV
jgi:hypothetical protein